MSFRSASIAGKNTEEIPAPLNGITAVGPFTRRTTARTSKMSSEICASTTGRTTAIVAPPGTLMCGVIAARSASASRSALGRSAVVISSGTMGATVSSSDGSSTPSDTIRFS
ncbi:hypothetical protein GCM10009565_51930 [Amycolatopsis albidoflavus]